MAIGPVIYPIIAPKQNNLQNMRVGAVGENKQQESIFLTPSGDKASKKVAFGEYEKKIAAKNDLVIRHEEAHKSASGSQASGSPVYETKADKDGRQIIIGGHQNVKLPEIADKNSPLEFINKIIEAAKLTIKGAEAPKSFDQLSSADERIAFQGRQSMVVSENAKAERLVIQKQFGIPADEKISPERLAQNKQDKPNSAQAKQAFTGQKLNLIG